jgi:hypothetical protein
MNDLTRAPRFSMINLRGFCWVTYPWLISNHSVHHVVNNLSDLLRSSCLFEKSTNNPLDRNKYSYYLWNQYTPCLIHNVEWKYQFLLLIHTKVCGLLRATTSCRLVRVELTRRGGSTARSQKWIDSRHLGLPRARESRLRNLPIEPCLKG